MNAYQTGCALLFSVGMFCLFGFGFVVFFAKLTRKRPR